MPSYRLLIDHLGHPCLDEEFSGDDPHEIRWQDELAGSRNPVAADLPPACDRFTRRVRPRSRDNPIRDIRNEAAENRRLEALHRRPQPS